MSRAHCPRRVRHVPGVMYFKPAGVPLRLLEDVALSLDEMEALRLADLKALHQTPAAEQMGVSRATFGRIVESARQKVADALVNTKALRIGGGPVLLPAAFHGVAQLTSNQKASISMRIAIPTDDEKTISPHFGHARGFVILTVENGQITDRETRRRQNGCDSHEPEHGGQRCEALVEMIDDCAVVLVCRMGGGPYRRVQAAGIRPVFTELTNLDEAVRSLLEGTLPESAPNLCH